MSSYPALTTTPPLVAAARRLAAASGFEASSIDEVGRLLHVLAGHVPGDRVAEVGTGYGVGTAWLASGLAPDARLWTIEVDGERAAAARELLADDPRVSVLDGDWRGVLEFAPFGLLFADARPAKEDPETLLRAVRPGGLVVLDDLTPEDQWPAEWHGHPDPVRSFWLDEPRVAATELLTTPSTAVIVARRL